MMRNFLILSIFLFYFLMEVNAQRGATNKKKNKIKPTFTIKKHKKTNDEEDQKQIQCLVCSAEFLVQDFDENHRCYNPGLDAKATKRSLLSTCPPETKFCITEVVRIHGVFAGINRKCGGLFCVEACFSRAFGIERETCTFCCEGVQSHHYKEVSEENVMNEYLSNDLNSNSISSNRSLTVEEKKEIKSKVIAEQMKSAYQCPPFFMKTEY